MERVFCRGGWINVSKDLCNCLNEKKALGENTWVCAEELVIIKEES